MQENFQTSDYREHSPITQILTIDPEEVKKVRALHPDVAVDLDLLRLLFTLTCFPDLY